MATGTWGGARFGVMGFTGMRTVVAYQENSYSEGLQTQIVIEKLILGLQDSAQLGIC
jgi:hypothetical protein